MKVERKVSHTKTQRHKEEKRGSANRRWMQMDATADGHRWMKVERKVSHTKTQGREKRECEPQMDATADERRWTQIGTDHYRWRAPIVDKNTKP